MEINVIGGGLAGVEAAWQAANSGAKVKLFEMRPVQQTPAHRTELLAEIVCSNSLKSDEVGSAPYLLKEELRRGNSLVMEVAEATKVPAGAALAVRRRDRRPDRDSIRQSDVHADRARRPHRMPVRRPLCHPDPIRQ